MHALVLALMLAAAAPETKSDAAIEAEIHTRLARSKIAADGFQVKVRNGTAVWTGKTGVVQHKGAASRIAKSAGATSVDNRIEVSAAAKAKASAHLRRSNRRMPRTQARSEQSRPESEPFVPPPVRRAVVKK